MRQGISADKCGGPGSGVIHHGGALQVQVHPGLQALDPTLAFRDFQLLNLKYDKLLSNFAFNCNLRHYITAEAGNPIMTFDTTDGQGGSGSG